MHIIANNTIELLNILYDYAEPYNEDFKNLRIRVSQLNSNIPELEFNFGNKELQESIYPALYKWVFNEGKLYPCDYFEIYFIGNSDGSITYDIENEINLKPDSLNFSFNVYKLNDNIRYGITFYSLVENSPQFTSDGIRLKYDRTNRLFPKVFKIF